MPIMVLSDTIWFFQVLNRVLYWWQSEAPTKALGSTIFCKSVSFTSARWMDGWMSLSLYSSHHAGCGRNRDDTFDFSPSLHSPRHFSVFASSFPSQTKSAVVNKYQCCKRQIPCAIIYRCCLIIYTPTQHTTLIIETYLPLFTLSRWEISCPVISGGGKLRSCMLKGCSLVYHYSSQTHFMNHDYRFYSNSFWLSEMFY